MYLSLNLFYVLQFLYLPLVSLKLPLLLSSPSTLDSHNQREKKAIVFVGPFLFKFASLREFFRIFLNYNLGEGGQWLRTLIKTSVSCGYFNFKFWKERFLELASLFHVYLEIRSLHIHRRTQVFSYLLNYSLLMSTHVSFVSVSSSES